MGKFSFFAAMTATIFISVVSKAENSTQCHLSDVEIGRLNEFVRIKQYLTKSVFPTWANTLPQMIVFDLKCQYILNRSTEAPEGFSLSPQTINIPTFSSSKLFYRRNVVKMPFGDELPIRILPTGFATTDSEGKSWFVFGLYEVWQSEFGDSLDTWFGMLAHEAFHPFQFQQPKIKAVVSAVSEDTFTKFYLNTPEFKKMVDQELAVLKDAILASSTSMKQKAIKRFFSIRENRRRQFYIGERASWIKLEPAVEAIEGVAEYMNFRFMTDCKGFPVNADLKKIDKNYTGFSSFKNFKIADALKAVAKSKSYTQKSGVYQVILLNEFNPNWQSEIFEIDEFGEGLLKRLMN